MIRARVQFVGENDLERPAEAEGAQLGEVLSLGDGRAAIADGNGGAWVRGLFGVLKVAGDRFEPGGIVRWDGGRARLEGEGLPVLGSVAGAGGAMDEELTVMLNG